MPSRAFTKHGQEMSLSLSLASYADTRTDVRFHECGTMDCIGTANPHWMFIAGAV